MAKNESQEIWNKKCQLYIFRDREDESRRGFEETRYTDIFLNQLKKKATQRSKLKRQNSAFKVNKTDRTSLMNP